jgi:hypothetical protein
MTEWDLIQSGQYEEACRVADLEFHRTSSLLPLRNKVRALLRLGRHSDAAKLCDEIISLSPFTVDADFIFRGVSDWLDGREQDAIAAWHAGEDTQYSDAAGGVEIPLLLLFAAIKRKDPSLRKSTEAMLNKLCKRRRVGNWPGPLAHFVLGKIDERSLLAAMKEPPVLQERQSCQGEFYIGAKRFASGDANGYAEYLARSCSHGPAGLLIHEFYLADAELPAISLMESGS